MMRYEADGTSGCVAAWSAGDAQPEADVGAPLPDARLAMRIAASGRPARVLDSVGSPIVVDGRLWGALIAQSATGRDFPRDVEQRLTNFTELVAAAIGNAESRLALTASRARVVAASDRERRRVVADLHDGAQQRLVHTVVTLKLVRSALARGGDVEPLVTEALGHAEQATSELRELAHGILPAVLTHGGLAAAVDALATRMHVDVENAVEVGRLPGPVEATAYFVVAEALTNVAKHAYAGRAVVLARVRDDMLELEVSDDGIGGACRDGSGLIGLADRVAVLNGALEVRSPDGGGTVVAATIPLERAAGSHATPARQELPHA
jgi:signal transduction histidine kinase